jgi:hypothetical protein
VVLCGPGEVVVAVLGDGGMDLSNMVALMLFRFVSFRGSNVVVVVVARSSFPSFCDCFE